MPSAARSHRRAAIGMIRAVPLVDVPAAPGIATPGCGVVLAHGTDAGELSGTGGGNS